LIKRCVETKRKGRHYFGAKRGGLDNEKSQLKFTAQKICNSILFPEAISNSCKFASKVS
jgi:hypothetical protein